MSCLCVRSRCASELSYFEEGVLVCYCEAVKFPVQIGIHFIRWHPACKVCLNDALAQEWSSGSIVLLAFSWSW